MRFVAIFLFFITTTLFSQIDTFNQDLQEGVFHYKQHKYEKALEIFDRLLINYPDNKRVRLEYARTLYALKMYKESKKEFIYILNQNPPDIVKKNIKYFIKKIDKKIKTNFFQAKVSIGVTNDSNIANKTFLETTQYGDFLLNNDIASHKDRFVTTQLSLTHMKKLENARWINSLYISNDFSHDNSADKVTIHNLSTTYVTPLFGLRVSLPLGLTYLYLDSKKYSKNISFSPSLGKRLSKSKSIDLSLSYQKNKNDIDTSKDTTSRGINGNFSWMINRFANSLGISLNRVKKIRGTRLDVAKKQQSFNFSTSHPILETNFLTMFYQHQKDKYTDVDPVLKYNRVDKKDNLDLSFNQQITNRNSFKISFTKSKNSSNINSYSYKKDIFSFKLSHKY